jgi:N-acetylmuramoyl-L-alanine amidase
VANQVIVIDPGHGGIDPGAVGYNGVKEKELVLQIAKRLGHVFSQAGAKVILTRESDKDLSTPGSGSLLTRKREDLANRVELANKNEASLYLSIHVNAFPSARWRGAQTFYQKGQNDSKRLAEAIQSELIRILGNTRRMAKAEDFFTTRKTKMAAVLIEVGFVSNPAEAELLADTAYQRKLAYAIYSGVVKYYKDQLTEQNQPVE